MLVIGAGIIGLSCAWRLAQRGHRVTIFDAGEAAREASWAGAGMLAPGGEIEEDSSLARLAMSSLSQYPDFVAELEDASGISIDYQRCGAIEVALNEPEAQALERRVIRQSAMGILSESITYSRSVSARFYPQDQVVDPREVTKALKVACLRLGVAIRNNEPVTLIQQDGSGLTTSLDVYRDEGILIAAGAWSSAFRPGLPLTIPVRGHLISYNPDRILLRTILRREGTYLLQRRGGSLIAGSSTEYVGFDRSIDERIVEEIHERASELLPDLSPMTPAERWNGFRPGVEGGNPVIGRIAGAAIWTAYGHYRNGILLAPETARIIAGLAG